MDDNEPKPGSFLETAWAIAGLLAGAALIFMAIDLLIPRKNDDLEPVADDSGA
jgi:hypothetical protein